MKKGDPIGEFLGRIFSPSMTRLFLRKPGDLETAREMQGRYDSWVERRLRISRDTPAIWKSILLWGILIIGFAIAFSLGFSRR
jgi:hypothetical protein